MVDGMPWIANGWTITETNADGRSLCLTKGFAHVHIIEADDGKVTYVPGTEENTKEKAK